MLLLLFNKQPARDPAEIFCRALRGNDGSARMEPKFQCDALQNISAGSLLAGYKHNYGSKSKFNRTIELLTPYPYHIADWIGLN